MLGRALGLAAVVVVLDQASKAAVLAALGGGPRVVEVTGFLNLALTWNRGISFGLLSGNAAAWQPWLLSGFAVAVCVGLLIWLVRARLGLLPGLGVGLIVGGAVGNVIDRLRFSAVVDFVDVHAGGWHWPAFNVADSAITLGVAGLLIDAVLRGSGGRE